jgi:hypothetical protein
VLRFLTILAALGAFALAQDPNRPIRTVGEFSNVRFTEEHAYGYGVEIWRDGGSLIGLFLAFDGLQGDTPAGLLENVKFDSRTGALSFTAKLTTGVTMLPGQRHEPSRDLFQFSGTLQGSTLTGVLKRSDQWQPSRPASSERIRLQKQSQTAMLQASSYADWKRQADEILRRRGPKW